MNNLVKLIINGNAISTVACIYTEESIEDNICYFRMLDIDYQKIAEFELNAEDLLILREKKNQYTEVSVFAGL